MPLTTPHGIVVPFTDQLSEGYQVVERVSGGYSLLVNIDASRIGDVFRELVQIVPDPGFLILESPCNEVRELELRKSKSDPFHRDVYYLDGLDRNQFLDIFQDYSDLLTNDGFINFGFGSHDTQHKNEVFVGAYKITTIFTDDPTDYEDVLRKFEIPKYEKLTTAWDTFTQENPGTKRRWSRDSFDIYEMIEILIRKNGLYNAKTIKEG